MKKLTLIMALLLIMVVCFGLGCKRKQKETPPPPFQRNHQIAWITPGWYCPHCNTYYTYYSEGLPVQCKCGADSNTLRKAYLVCPEDYKSWVWVERSHYCIECERSYVGERPAQCVCGADPNKLLDYYELRMETRLWQ